MHERSKDPCKYLTDVTFGAFTDDAIEFLRQYLVEILTASLYKTFAELQDIAIEEGNTYSVHFEPFIKKFQSVYFSMFHTKIEDLPARSSPLVSLTDWCHSIFYEMRGRLNAEKTELIEMILDRSVYVPLDIHPSAQEEIPCAARANILG